MTRMPTWCGVIAVFVLAFGLSACKSSSTRCTDCAPTTPAPIADTQFPPDAPSYPPPPALPVESGVSSAEFAAAKDRADLEAQRRAEVEAQLRAEQDRLAAAQRELEDANRMLTDRPPAGEPQLQPVMPEVDRADRLIADLRARSIADVVRDGDMVVVRVTNGFKAGSDLLKKDVQLITTLNAVADALAQHPGASVSVIGHSDGDPIKVTKGKWRDNDDLSLARAQRVASVLASNDVEMNRISIDGRGAREPLVSPERTRADKARNRRVEIMIRL